MWEAPVDLSFRNLNKLTDALTEEPNVGLRPLKKNSKDKYDTLAIRLNNNNITDLINIHYTINHFLANPSHLAWLDLSFNKLSQVDQVLCELHALRVLYLHGNNISALTEVNKLTVLPCLHSITLHGNPIEITKTYRNHVIFVLPRLKIMDFTAVTQHERGLARHLVMRHRDSKKGFQ